MSVQQTHYQGDAALDRLLRESRSQYNAKTVRVFLEGVLAAPQGEDPDEWMALVTAVPPEALRGQLRALKAELAATLSSKDGPIDRGARLVALREELARRQLDGFVVPRADEHQGEYVAARAQRLAWLTGFTGSAGVAIVLRNRAAMFVDGRYTLQVKAEVDTTRFTVHHLTEDPPHDWIARSLSTDQNLAYDPWLHTASQVAQLRSGAEKAGGALVACEDNPLDTIWTDQPAAPISPVRPHPLEYSGRAATEKREELSRVLAEQGADAAVLTLPDSIAWLLNVRGGDVPHTPLCLSFAVLRCDGTVDWFVDRRKLVPGLESHLGNGVAVRSPERLGEVLDGLGRDGARVMVDPATAASWVFNRLETAGAGVLRAVDPCQLPKAKKNPVELAGSKAAHRRDGAALARFLAWLAEEAPRRAADGAVTELESAERLAAFRRENELFRDLSFDTISGAGPNGAIVHYRVTASTSRPLRLGELYLVDSGGQYLDGTTDVTRTVAIGQPKAEMRDHFTRVLKGHIAIATARFPRGTTGSQIDVLARTALWQAGLDYDHGTGHGVGSYLGVHEGPQRISKVPNQIALEPGMIVSNEPGYYKVGEYGMRIENLVTVVEAESLSHDERSMLGFETLTLAPIDLALVETSLLTTDEVAWLDAYHARVRESVSPLVDAATAAWLEKATRPIIGDRT